MEKGLLVVCSSVHSVLKHEEVLGVLPAEAHGGDHPRCCCASMSYRNQVNSGSSFCVELSSYSRKAHFFFVLWSPATIHTSYLLQSRNALFCELDLRFGKQTCLIDLVIQSS